MVCLGNICRSPLAEGVLKAKAIAAGLDWEVDSAGTSSYHSGELPDSRSIDVANLHGLDITNQRSRQIKRQDLNDFDVIYVMDSSNYNDVIDLCNTPEQEAKVKIIMNEVMPEMNVAVPDPYYGDNGFENVYQMLDEACDAVIAGYN